MIVACRAGRIRPVACAQEGVLVNRHLWYPVILLACLSTVASADDRDDYNRRSTERFVALFRAAEAIPNGARLSAADLDAWTAAGAR